VSGKGKMVSYFVTGKGEMVFYFPWEFPCSLVRFSTVNFQIPLLLSPVQFNH
jgi:hypothetical protein